MNVSIHPPLGESRCREGDLDGLDTWKEILVEVNQEEVARERREESRQYGRHRTCEEVREEEWGRWFYWGVGV
jgi:hypothetical protein